MELDRVPFLRSVLNPGHRVMSLGHQFETRRELERFVAGRHPDSKFLGQPLKENRIRHYIALGGAVLALVGGADFAAERVHHELQSKADAENGQAQFEDARVGRRSVLVVDRPRRSREHDADGRVASYLIELSRAGADLARHYGVAVVPARSRKPRDKAKVENAVLQVERWVLAPLRSQVFFSLEELQSAIAAELRMLNDKKLTDLPMSRREFFELEERPKLGPLPDSRYIFAEWRKAKVGPDYHVRFESHAYSVPHRYCGKTVDVRLTTFRVEVSLDGEILASHERGIGHRYISTVPEHMPQAHREHAEWTPARLLGWASEFGPCRSE